MWWWFYVRSNRLPEALAFMQSHEARVPAEASEFWRLLGEVAWDLQRVDIARGAYANYVKSESATSDDWSRLVALAGAQQAGQAANLALEGYRRFGTFALLTQALEMFANQAQWTRMGEALATIARGRHSPMPSHRASFCCCAPGMRKASNKRITRGPICAEPW